VCGVYLGEDELMHFCSRTKKIPYHFEDWKNSWIGQFIAWCYHDVDMMGMIEDFPDCIFWFVWNTEDKHQLVDVYLSTEDRYIPYNVYSELLSEYDVRPVEPIVQGDVRDAIQEMPIDIIIKDYDFENEFGVNNWAKANKE
jgi:hypothetical protein